jgi:hypothetical protein
VQFSFLPLRSALDTSCSVFLSSPARLVFDLVFSGVAFSSVLVADFPSVHSGLAGSLFSVEHFADRFQLPSPASFTSPSLIFLAARQSALIRKIQWLPSREFLCPVRLFCLGSAVAIEALHDFVSFVAGPSSQL